MAGVAFTYWLHALSPLHAGAGRGDGYIDLPLIREKITGFPYVPGSSIKGVIADSLGAAAGARGGNPVHRAAFGTADAKDQGNSANAGRLAFADARLLCLPARSLFGTFAWCTSPLVLRRLARDMAMAGESPPGTNLAPPPEGALIPPTVARSALVDAQRGKVYLEDWDLPVVESTDVGSWADLIAGRLFPPKSEWHAMFRARFLVLPDDLFNFLSQTGTEVQAHVRIDEEQKRVADGALWYEESLPAETILAGVVGCDSPRFKEDVPDVDLLGLLTGRNAEAPLQIGGKATVGKGLCHLRFAGKPSTHAAEKGANE